MLWNQALHKYLTFIRTIWYVHFMLFHNVIIKQNMCTSLNWLTVAPPEKSELISGSSILEVNPCEYWPLCRKGRWYSISCSAKPLAHVNRAVQHLLQSLLHSRKPMSQIYLRYPLGRYSRGTWLVSFAVNRGHNSLGCFSSFLSCPKSLLFSLFFSFFLILEKLAT